MSGVGNEYVCDTLGALRDALPAVDSGNIEQMSAVEVSEALYARWQTLVYARNRFDCVEPEDGQAEVHRHVVDYLEDEMSWAECSYIEASENLLRLLGQPVPPAKGAHVGNDGGDFVGFLLPTPESIRFAAPGEEPSPSCHDVKEEASR